MRKSDFYSFSRVHNPLIKGIMTWTNRRLHPESDYERAIMNGVYDNVESLDLNSTKGYTSNNSEDIIRVLHVYDEPEILLIAKKALNREDKGLLIESVETLDELLQLLAEGRYDCIVSDYQMPTINGIELVRRVREFSNIPIIIYTSRGSEEVAEASFSAGVDDYLRKELGPSHYKVLAKRIRMAVEKRRAEEQLRASEERFRGIAERNIDAILVMDIFGTVNYISPSAEKIFGLNPVDMLGRGFPSFIPEYEHSKIDEILRSAIDRTSVEFLELNVIGGEGLPTPVEVSTSSIIRGGEVVGVQGVVRDVSERVRAEDMYQHLFEFCPVGIVYTDETGVISSLNPTARSLTVNRDDEVIGKKFVEVFSVSDGDIPILYDPNLSGESETENKPLKCQIFGNEGAGRWIEVYSAPIEMRGVFLGTQIVMMDITGRKRAEEESEEARRHFETLFQVTVDPVVIVDSGGTILEITERIEEITGFTRGELLGRNFLETKVVSERSKLVLMSNLKERLLGRDIPSYEVGLLTKDGRELLFDVKAKSIEYGGSPAVMASFRDIGERKVMELRLRESEGRLRQLIEHAPDSILILDLEGAVVDCNAATLKLYGYSSKSEVVGRSSFEFIAEMDRGKALDSLGMTLKAEFDKDREYRLLRKDGTEFKGEISASLVRDDLGEPVSIITVTEDVTETRRYQERLESLHRHASELTSVDTLEEIAERSFAVIESILGFGHGGFGVVDEFSLCFIKMAGDALEQVVELPLDGPGITVRAAVTGETQFVTDIRFDEDYVPIVVGDDYSYQQELAVPVKIEGEVVAVLNVESAMTDAFSEEDRILIEILALHVASAIANIRQRERIRSSEGELRGERDRLRTVNEKLNVVGRLSRHDVRNKLSIIINNLYILRQILGNESELTSYLERIDDTCGSITDIFDFAADYERLGLEEMKPVNAGEAFRMAVSMFDVSEVNVENGCGGLIVYADSLLSRLFYNLIDNSLKHGGGVGWISLSKEICGGEVHVVYEDDGVGIEGGLKRDLFIVNGDMRVHGLHMLLKIVESYGWSIREEGVPGEGVRFVISLPLDLLHEGQIAIVE